MNALNKPTTSLTEALNSVPEHQRHRIVSGMRWTVWLSAISFPFSYGTTVLLARTGPEAIGTYGLLSVYLGVILGLFYLGGDAVAIKFLPELDPAQRLSFLASYFVVVCLALLPWLGAATIWPDKLHYLLGEKASPSFQLFIMFLSPLSILLSLVGAALKGMLEISWAQMIARVVTIGSFLIYATVFFSSQAFLARSYTQVIWGTYFGVCTIGAIIGLRRFWQLNGRQGNWRSLKFFLPRGFWHYALSLQQLSTLWFFTGRLDAILVLNFANLAVLGQYFAVITLVEAILVINRFFLDTLLPSLTNMIAAKNLTAAADIFATHMRILFLVNTGSTCGIILLAGSITVVLGPKYTSLGPMIVLLALLVGLAAPSGVGSTLLSSVGKQQRAVWVVLGQVALYVGLFLFLWPRWHLLGAVLAYGLEWLIAGPLLLLVAKRSVPFTFSLIGDYTVFGLIAIAAASLERLRPLDLPLGVLAWLVAMGLFLLLARYSVDECRRLLRCFSPFSLNITPKKRLS